MFNRALRIYEDEVMKPFRRRTVDRQGIGVGVLFKVSSGTNVVERTDPSARYRGLFRTESSR